VPVQGRAERAWLHRVLDQGEPAARPLAIEPEADAEAAELDGVALTQAQDLAHSARSTAGSWPAAATGPSTSSRE
jgi:hypothetical protein